MPYDFGDVVLVRFPFTNQIGSKQRPAVVASTRAYNDIKPDVVMMAVTSQLRASQSWLVTAEWTAANLLKPSAIKPVFATVEQSLIVRGLGSLASLDRLALRTAINTILGE